MSETHKLLIIEDDESTNEALAEHLAEDYEVECFFDASKALKRFETSDFDCVIIGFPVPGFSGGEIIKALKEIKKVPMLVCADKKFKAQKTDALASGASKGFAKPLEDLADVSNLLLQVLDFDE
jgi:DNA-binding response OmpR family regulator